MTSASTSVVSAPGGSGGKAYAVGIALVVAAVWAGATGGGFTLDSAPIVRDNPAVTSFDVATLLSTDWWGAGGQAGGLYRPVAGLWLSAWMKLGGGAASAVLFGNVLLHVIAAVLRFRLFSLLLAGRRRAEFAAALAALLPALHPSCVEAVATPVGAADLLAVALGTAAVLCGLGTTRFSALGAVVCAAAAVLSKESAVVVPVAAWGASALLGARRPAGRPSWAVAVPLLIGVALALAIRFFMLGGWAAGDPVHAGFSTVSRMASAFAAFATSTLPMLVAPASMVPVVGHHDVLPAAGFSDPRAFLGVAIVALGLAGAWVASASGRREWWWGLLVFFAFLFPVSNLLVPTGALTAARFLVPALPWLCLPLVATLVCGREDRPSTSSVGVAVGLLAAAVGGYASARDLAAWKDDFALFTMEAARSPSGVHGPYNLAVAKFVNDPEGARVLLARVVAAPSVLVPGTSIPTEDIEELRFQAAMNLGKLEVELYKNPSKARAAFDRAAATARGMRLHAAPWHTTSWRDQEAAALRARSAGSVYALTTEPSAEARTAYFADAAADLDAARMITPDNPEIHEARARLHLMKGEKEPFLALVAKVLAEHPNTPSAWSLEALRLRNEGRTAAALPLEARVVLRSPMNASPDQLLQLGKACLGSDDLAVRRQGAELVRLGMLRAQGNPALQRLIGEARQALMAASLPQEPVGPPKPP